MKKLKTNLFVVFLLICLLGCEISTTPRPEGYVRLEYPEAVYDSFQTPCPFTFEYNTFTKTEKDSLCWYTLAYPDLKGKLYLTYYDIKKEELPQLIKQSEKLVFEHTIKASGIDPEQFYNNDQKVYGTFYELLGESATNFQFYVTDSAQHFLQGSFYFRAQPKPDSLMPAVNYIKQDIIHLISSTRWKD